MKAIVIGALVAFAGHALAGEDSTDHWGAGGTGPAWYQTKCGLAGFTGPSDDNRRPCSDKSREVVEVFTPGKASASKRQTPARRPVARTSS